MRFSRSLLHSVHEAAVQPVVAPRLRQRLLAHEIIELAEGIKTGRAEYTQALSEYNKEIETAKNTKLNEELEASEGTESSEAGFKSTLPEPPKPTVPLDGNAYFQTLPIPLANFLKKYPPSPFREYSKVPVTLDHPEANPFIGNINPVTNKRHDPVYSLRRQSDLYKAAYRYGIAHLLPPLANGKMFYEEKYEKKPVLRGATRFKLTIGERNAPERKREMAEAIAKADEIIAKAKGSKWRKKMESKNKKPLPWF